MTRGLVLCCGAGGASEGLRQAGHMATVVVDVWELALQTHEANHPDAEHVKADVRDLVGSLGRFDWIQGSPPCPDYSSMGRRGRNADASIIEACIAIQEEAKPKWWAWENVPLAEPEFRRRGQATTILRACDYGLPHERRRVWAGNFSIPDATDPTEVLYTTPMASDYKRGPSKGSFQVHSLRHHLGHPVSTAENLEAMGFPPGYVVLGRKHDQVRQIGNAVPPPVARAVGRAQTAGPRLTRLPFAAEDALQHQGGE
jgi:site-specific DNA-cytosine methylase